MIFAIANTIIRMASVENDAAKIRIKLVMIAAMKFCDILWNIFGIGNPFCGLFLKCSLSLVVLPLST